MTDVDARLARLAAAAARVHTGPSKRMALSDAVRRFVRPGMHLHVTSGLNRPVASLFEVLRAFAGRRPAFTLSFMSVAGPHVLLATEGVVDELVCTFHGDTLPTPGPNPAIQRAYADGAFRLSSWSILSFTQRLLAGALGVPWMPTRSLAGSSMAEQDDVVEVAGQLAVTALVPDVAFVHAPAADEYGNVLLGGPFGDACLGAWAAREGAVVTVERIVGSDVVAAHPTSVRLPAAKVLSVSEVPFGAHPGPLYCGGVEDVVGPIAEDAAFVAAFRDACREPASLDAWAKTWVYGVGHDDYLARLGAEHLSALRGRAQLASWREDVAALGERILRSEDPSGGELAVVGGARELARRVRASGLQTVLAGVGQSNLAAWLARAALADEGVHLALMVELGLYDYVPPPGDPLLASNRVTSTASSLVGVLDVLGSALASTRSAGVLGAGQVDRRGNLNSSRAADGGLLVGSGGSNDVASICEEVVVVARQSRARFVDEVPYVTAPGTRVRSVATQHGILRKDADGELVLVAVWADDGVARARADCGWDLRVAGDPERLAPPTGQELELVRAFDPREEYTG